MRLSHKGFQTIVRILTSATFWIAVSAVGAFLTLYCIRLDTSHTAHITAYEFLRREDERYNSEKMQRERSQLAMLFLTREGKYAEIDSLLENKDVWNFFEDLGIITRTKIAPADLIWNMFSEDIELYWNASKGNIFWERRKYKDPNIYSEFEYTFNEMVRIDKKRFRKEAFNYSIEEIRDDLKNELTPQDKKEYMAWEDSLNMERNPTGHTPPIRPIKKVDSRQGKNR